MRRPENRPAPASLIDARAQLSYDMQCDSWARGLPEGTLREFAYEYMRTPDSMREEYMIDAHAEYIRRESLGMLSHQRSAESTLSARKSRARRSSRK